MNKRFKRMNGFGTCLTVPRLCHSPQCNQGKTEVKIKNDAVRVPHNNFSGDNDEMTSFIYSCIYLFTARTYTQTKFWYCL